MDRKRFLTSFLTSQPKVPEQKFDQLERTSSGLSPYSGPWNTAQVTHLLKRTMFGAQKTDIDYFKSKTVSAAVDELVNTVVPVPSPPVNNYAAAVTDPDVPAGQTWVNAPYAQPVNNRRIISLTSWWIGLQVQQTRSLTEKMVLFWHNHFPIDQATVNNSGYLYGYNALLREFSLGNFKDFVKRITLEPAMLVYLNGRANKNGAPDENYARELQELFTMGKGLASMYTEDDVKAAAKVLTGYKDDPVARSYTFNPNNHDTTNKQFSSFYNNTIIAGKTGATGEQELDDLLAMLFQQDELSMFICRKLYRFFVYYTIDATTETNVIAPLATIFKNNNYEIKPVLLALFKSEHFYDVLNMGCMIKSPIDFMVGLCREFDVLFPDETIDYVPAYNLWQLINTTSSAINQGLLNPPNVAGWAAYYQEPQFYELWINADSLPKRNKFSDVMIGSGYTMSGKKMIIDPITFADGLSNPLDPNILISDSLDILYKIDVTQTTKDYLKTQILLSGQSSDSYWTAAWNTYKADPTNNTNKNIVLTRLRALYKYIMDLSEYQLC
ncbi:MAG: DUF1800 domain-containing protein [Bacteroidetes bacterium]|nr:DUF1800 domain-containing protein [Bacteroidota bacterium]